MQRTERRLMQNRAVQSGNPKLVQRAIQPVISGLGSSALRYRARISANLRPLSRSLSTAMAFAVFNLGVFAGPAAVSAESRVQPPAAAGSSYQTVVPKGAAKLVAALRRVNPNIPIERIYPAEMNGFFGVDIMGGQVLYGTADGRYIITGELFATGFETGAEVVNLTEQHRAVIRKDLMAAIPLKDMIVFPAKGQPRDYVQIFTDVDCGYCQKLHAEMAGYNELGIEVRYLAYPRAGLDSESYTKIVGAWCAEDPQGALTAVKAGATIVLNDCSNPVADQYRLGQQIGVQGTPAIVTSTGQMLPGYLPPQELAGRIGLE